MKSSYFIRPNQ